MSIRPFFAILALIAGLAAPALAQDANPPKPGKHEESRAPGGITTKGFGSWALRCEAAHTEGAEPSCEISETIQTASNKTVAKISVGRSHPGDPLMILILLPNNVSFPSTVHIRTSKDDKWGIELQWLRCVPGACVAGAELNPSTIAHWSDLKSDGSIVFVDAAGDEVALPISMLGFGDAYAAFDK